MVKSPLELIGKYYKRALIEKQKLGTSSKHRASASQLINKLAGPQLTSFSPHPHPSAFSVLK
jgi:hypothetical protein